MDSRTANCHLVNRSIFANKMMQRYVFSKYISIKNIKKYKKEPFFAQEVVFLSQIKHISIHYLIKR